MPQIHLRWRRLNPEVATVQERLHCRTASVAEAHAARKLAYKKYIDVKKVICFNNVPARFTSYDRNIFPDVAGIIQP